ncbi:MAG: ABC transporter substrate-binding protein, partial [Planctomycetota bacterium]
LTVTNSTSTQTAPTVTQASDDSWSVPGVKITRPELYGHYITDPANSSNYQQGGEFFELAGAPPDKLTPYIGGDVTARDVNAYVFQALAIRDRRSPFGWVGVLGEAWQVDPAGLWVRAKIFDNAAWSDGTPLTAHDYAWTYHNYTHNELVNAERTRSVTTQLVDVKAISDKVVEFVFSEPVYSNESIALDYLPLPEHFYSGFTPEQINASSALQLGSGMYRLPDPSYEAQWTRSDTDYVLVKNRRYWGDEQPTFDSVRFRFITDFGSRLQSFENGEGHLTRVTSKQYADKIADEEFLEKANIHVWTNVQSAYSYIAWNSGVRGDGKTTPFDDVRVRRAMTMFVDRERIIRDELEGLGDVAYGPNPPGPATSPDVKPFPYDPAAAVALLEEAGWADTNGDNILDKDGKNFTFTYTIPAGVEAWVRIANQISNELRKYGVECSVEIQEWSRFSEMLKNRNFDAISLAWSASGPESDPRQLWHPDSADPGEGDNYSQWRNERAGEIIDQGRRTIDRDERMKLWQELHELIHEEQPYTFMVRRPSIVVIDKEVGNFHEYDLNLHRIEFFLQPDVN